MDLKYDPSLVLYLPLYELDGASCLSRDKHGHLATVTGALWAPGGRDFDGVDDRITVASHSSFYLSGDFTIIAIINMDSITGAWWERSWLFHGLATGNKWFFAYDGAATRFEWFNGSLYTVVGDAWTLTLGQTYYIGITRVGNTWTFYKDGVVNGTASHSQPVAQVTQDLRIGSGQSAYQYDGRIGEVFLYQRGLTPLEIQQNYLATKWRYQ